MVISKIDPNIIGRFCENEFLNSDALITIHNWIRNQEWEDGIKSLQWLGDRNLHDLKRNQGTKKELPGYIFWPHVDNNQRFTRFTEPKQSSSIHCTRTPTGGYYKPHFDDYNLGNFSTTIFLNEPDEYDGGELVLWLDGKERFFKPKAGHGITYETGIGHRVNTVTKGERLVIVFWTTSRWTDINMFRKFKYYDYMTQYSYDDKIYDTLDEYCNSAQTVIRRRTENILKGQFRDCPQHLDSLT